MERRFCICVVQHHQARRCAGVLRTLYLSSFGSCRLTMSGHHFLSSFLERPHLPMWQVWSVQDSEWHCKIDEGPVGLAHARWSPDGRSQCDVCLHRRFSMCCSPCLRWAYGQVHVDCCERHLTLGNCGRHVLAIADLNLRITIWSMLDRSVRYIRYPKLLREGLDFSRQV